MGSGMGSLKCAWGSAKAPLTCDTLATFFFFFKYSLFTMLCQFLLYSKVTQSYIYIHSFSYYLPSWFIPRDHSSLCCRVGLHCLSILLLLLSFFFFRAACAAYGSSPARSRIGAAAASLQHSYGNTRSEPRLQPTPQLMARLNT